MKPTETPKPEVPQAFKSALVLLRESEAELTEAKTALDKAEEVEAAARLSGPGRAEREALAKVRERHEDGAHVVQLRRDAVTAARAEVAPALAREFALWCVAQTATLNASTLAALPEIIGALDRLIDMNAAHNEAVESQRQSLCADLGLNPHSPEAQAHFQSRNFPVAGAITGARSGLSNWAAQLTPRPETPTISETWTATQNPDGTWNRNVPAVE